MANPSDLRRVNPPPSTGQNGFDQWAQDVTDALNALPVMSTFSGSTPESTVTGIPGAVVVNYASSGSRAWVKQSGEGTTTGWIPIA